MKMNIEIKEHGYRTWVHTKIKKIKASFTIFDLSKTNFRREPQQKIGGFESLEPHNMKSIEEVEAIIEVLKQVVDLAKQKRDQS